MGWRRDTFELDDSCSDEGPLVEILEVWVESENIYPLQEDLG